jgi:hypothetical protein
MIPMRILNAISTGWANCKVKNSDAPYTGNFLRPDDKYPNFYFQFMRIISCFFLLAILLSGCYGETKCPSFSDEYLSWFPYKAGQQISFSNGSDTLILTVQKISRSPGYSKSRYCGCYCESAANLKMYSDSAHNLSVTADIFVLDQYISYSIEMEGQFEESGDSQFYRNFFSFSISDQEAGGGILLDSTYDGYQRVLQLENDTSWRDINFWQLFLADSTGIIQMTERNQIFPWKLIK